jgi:hypothetical protein
MALSWEVWRNDERIKKAANNNPSMKFGEKGQAVHLLQAALILNEIDVPHHGIGDNGLQNNNYLNETQAAVRQAEGKFGLSLHDKGIAGKQVIGALDNANNRFYTSNKGHFGSDLAVQDAPRAQTKVQSALTGLAALRAAMNLPKPVGLNTVVSQALRVHFRLLAPGTTGPGVARQATIADIDRIIATYRNILFVLRGATFTFRDGIPVNGVKIAAESFEGSRRVTFGPAFRDFGNNTDLIGGPIGKESRAAVVIHESMHAVDDSHTSGQRNIHISEFQAAYDVQPADLSLFNPSSYASFAAHVALGRDPQPRFGLGPNSRGL